MSTKGILINTLEIRKYHRPRRENLHEKNFRDTTNIFRSTKCESTFITETTEIENFTTNSWLVLRLFWYYYLSFVEHGAGVVISWFAHENDKHEQWTKKKEQFNNIIRENLSRFVERKRRRIIPRIFAEKLPL